MNNLIKCYKNGKKTEKNLEKAFYWYQKAAESGNKSAMNNLAICYENGKGTEKNLEKAFYWFQKAAENGNGNAMNNLATYNYIGEGTEKNLEKAFYWTQKAAENSNVNAMHNLVALYCNGEGTEKNTEKKLKEIYHWYHKSIEIAQNSTQDKNEYFSIMTKLIKPMKRFIITESEDEIYDKCNECHLKRRPSKRNHQICIICYQANLLY